MLISSPGTIVRRRRLLGLLVIAVAVVALTGMTVVMGIAQMA